MMVSLRLFIGSVPPGQVQPSWEQGKQLFEQYVFADWQFLTFLGVLVCIDTLLGLIKSYKTGSLSLRFFGLVAGKVLIYACFLVLAHIVSHYTIEGVKNEFFGWFNNFAYSAIIVRESISVLENMGAIRPGLIPDWILKKLKQYDKNGRFDSRPSDKIPS
jgi:phage-related holin